MHFKPAAAPKAIGCRQSAYLLAFGIFAAGVFGVLPAIWDIADYFRFLAPQPNGFVARWALLILLISVLQVAYAVYLLQLPDWTSVWVVTIFLLAVAGVYAMSLGLIILASPTGWLLGSEGLQLADRLAGGKAALWCLSMIGISTMLAYFSGRLARHWHRTELTLRRAGL
jgi:hypothetical protein